MICGVTTDFDKSINRRMNVRPEGTTLAAKESFPINDKSSLFVHFFLIVHCFIRSWISLHLDCGRPSDILSEFISIPKNVMHEVGPNEFVIRKGYSERLKKHNRATHIILTLV